jgi:hypothetical protein
MVLVVADAHVVTAVSVIVAVAICALPAELQSSSEESRQKNYTFADMMLPDLVIPFY